MCDVAALVDPDIETVDALARLQLTVKRVGGSLRLRGTSARLEELLALTGLDEVMLTGLDEVMPRTCSDRPPSGDGLY